MDSVQGEEHNALKKFLTPPGIFDGIVSVLV